MRRLCAALLVLLALSKARTGRAYSGAEPFDFLFLDANARAVAMGGAYTAMGGDANALLYNPAGLAKTSRHEATFMHNQYFEGISQEYLAYASPRGWGADLDYLKFGDVPKTTISNPTGAGLGSESLTDLALAAGYGLPLGPSFSIGAGLKYIRETVAHVTGQGVAVDLGLLGSVPAVRGLSYGLSLQNLGPSVRFQAEDEDMPLNLRMGTSYAFEVKGQRSVVSLDMTRERSEGALIGVGAETVVAGLVPVRLGFNSRNKAGPGVTVGVGWLYRDVSFDYAFVPFGDLGSAHRVSLSWGWGKDRVPPAATEASRAPASRVRTDVPDEAREERLVEADRLMERGDWDGARRALETALTLLDGDDRRRVRAYERLGHAARMQLDFPKAKAYFAEALSSAEGFGMRGPRVADADLGMGLCLIHDKALEAARGYLLKALEADPSPETRRQAETLLKGGSDELGPL